MGRVMGRVWPDGEAVCWYEDRAAIAEFDNANLLGLSKVSNSQDALLGSDETVSQRGLNGITNYGARLVRNAAYCLQKIYGRERLSFCTTTLVGGPQETCAVAVHWSELVRRFMQAVKEKLVRHQLPPFVVAVTEIQMKRFRRTGGMPLHLHMVFVGKHKGRGAPWEISTDWFDECWRRAVTRLVPELKDFSWRSSCNMQGVRKSAKGYLGKYLSKGVGAVTEVLEECPELAEFMPRSWYSCTNPLRDLVLANVAYGEDVGECLEEWNLSPHGAVCLEWVKQHTVYSEAGLPVAKFLCIQLTTYGKRMMGIPLSPWDFRDVPTDTI